MTVMSTETRKAERLFGRGLPRAEPKVASHSVKCSAQRGQDQDRRSGCVDISVVFWVNVNDRLWFLIRMHRTNSMLVPSPAWLDSVSMSTVQYAHEQSRAEHILYESQRSSLV